jgi:putative DNA methylase
MIPRECKRLAEVDFPIAEVSKHSAREKSIHHGHPSTLHLWWARRPLAACRAMLLALLLPDPADKLCPEDFSDKARKLLLQLRGKIGAKPLDLRHALLKFIGEFANWDLAADQSYLEVSRGLVRAAHDGEPPLVVDPFAGGGSIPLEALRLGCDTFASDLNPVACLILRAMLEDIPRAGRGLADELRRVGAEIKRAARKQLVEFYPVDPHSAVPIAYLWARTVHCESPNCGAEIPLVRTNWLAKRFNKKSKHYTKLVSLDLKGDSKRKVVEATITIHKTPSDKLPEIPGPTAIGGKAHCPCCNVVLSDKRVRQQLAEQQGGGDTFIENNVRVKGARLMAVILRKDGDVIYRLPTDRDLHAVSKAQNRLKELASSPDFAPLPSEPLSTIRPSPNARGVSGATRIGITDFGRLFTSRQKLALHELSMAAKNASGSGTLQDLMLLAVTKQVERSTNFVTWINSSEAPRGTFARQALTIAWDFIELVPIAETEEFPELVEAMANVVEKIMQAKIKAGQIQQAEASKSPLPDDSCAVWFTDPPYYDAVPYADLSDIFYTWLKRIIPEEKLNNLSATCSDGLTPKLQECTWNQAHLINQQPKSPQFFETCVSTAFAEGRRVLDDSGIACVVFAHKTTEGWEALLGGLLAAGWIISASWPVATERAGKLGGKDKAMLMTSVHLVCCPRPANAGIGDWSKVLRELPNRVGDWMERLQGEGIRGADLVFACIGPALEIFSRFSKVETAEGREVALPEYLTKVWEVVGRTALEQVLGTAEAKARNGAAGALEEDARLTALFLWTLQSTTADIGRNQDDDAIQEGEEEEAAEGKKKKKGAVLIFDVVRRFAQPLGIYLPDWEGRVIETEKGVVRLLPVRERAIQLFGQEGVHGAASHIERGGDTQLVLFPESRETIAPRVHGSRAAAGATQMTQRDATTLDRVHAAMLLQASGQANALRALLEAEQERGPDFLRLANALSALYSKENDEKRLLDAMLLAVPK